MRRTTFIRGAAGLLASAGWLAGCRTNQQTGTTGEKEATMTTEVERDGTIYVPYDQREGEESVVYLTRDLSADGLCSIFQRVAGPIGGKVAIKLHTGEPDGPNIIPRPWVEQLVDRELPGATIVETNTYYDGGRYTTEEHRRTIAHNGWTFCPVDILDEDGDVYWPCEGATWLPQIAMGAHLADYDSLVALTHFKGHTQGGFGGSNKNLGIGCASGQVGKRQIHTYPDSDEQWGIAEEDFMERMTESTKAVVDHFGEHIVYVNVMRNMSVSCDCEGTAAQPVVTPNVGIVASLDPLAVDQASVDIVFAMDEADGAALRERIISRHGLRQLSYMGELSMGNDRYRLVDIDHDDEEIRAADAARDLIPFDEDDR